MEIVMLRTATLYARLKALNVPCKEIVSMSNHTTMQVGGIAPVVAYVRNAEEMITAIREAKNNGVKYAVMGNGSNVIVSDDGFDGLVIVTTDMKKFSLEGNLIKADCGASLTRLAVAAQRESLSGLEFAYGIPGTVGGGVFMNAGAFGGSL
ncbi:MAG: FAD-binding protein, partial [Clostridia bacterium]|nr:FAD-binding protein [Clostridia bacterium]